MKSNLDDVFKVDKRHAEEGVDFVVKRANPEEGTAELSFRVRHFSTENSRTKAAMAAYLKPHVRQIELGTLDQKIKDEIEIKLFLDISLVSWQGVEIDGKSADCNKENATKLFKSLPNLFKSLLAYSQDFTNYKEELGNS